MGKIREPCVYTYFIINLIHQWHVNMNFSQIILFTPNVILLRTSPTPPPPCPLVGSKLSKLMYIPQQ